MISITDIASHLDTVADAAGLQVMNSDGVLGIIADREVVDADTLAELTPGDVDDLYQTFIAPAIDALENHLIADDPAEADD